MLELCNDSPERREFWKGKKVLVTGATGMLGSWMTHALVGFGATVTAIIRDKIPQSLLWEDNTINQINVAYGDFKDADFVQRVLFEYECEYIFHLGAQTQVRTANRNPTETFKTNVNGTWNMLEAARLAPTTKAVLIASSDKAYGTQPVLPYTEEAPLQGEHPYDVSKSCADLLSRCYYLTYDLPVCVTRCGNLYGPGDRNFDRIIPGTIKSVLEGQQPIIRSDGTFIRDYFFVPDAVDGYLTIAENMDRKEILGEAFNLSTMNRITVLDLFNTIIEVMGKDLKPKILNQASNEIKEQSLSSDKAGKMLDWNSRHTIEEGLAITVDWYKEILK